MAVPNRSRRLRRDNALAVAKTTANAERKLDPDVDPWSIWISVHITKQEYLASVTDIIRLKVESAIASLREKASELWD